MGELDWRPNRGPQAAFLMCPVGEILYGGAKGGGKSDAIGPKAVKHALRHGEHATVLILRETMPQLRDLMKRVRARQGEHGEVAYRVRRRAGQR